MAAAPSRLVELDALRGIAAMAVVLFHLTTRYAELYPSTVAPALDFPLGHYGVNLFFMISGYVIFMTLQRTRVAMDFVVSRFSRLYPAYWAAVAVTFAVTHLMGLPGHEQRLQTAVLNLLMFHGLFNVPHVDGAYWTLEVELLFYTAMFALFMSRRIRQVHWWMLGLLALRGVYFAAENFMGISLPWFVYHLLILKFVPWFALGVAMHALADRSASVPRSGAWASGGLALLTIFATETAFLGLLTVVLVVLLYAAVTGRLRPLAWGPLAWLGSISYPLYLLHEYVGWSVMLTLMRRGVGTNAAVALALGLALLLAHAVSRGVEQPAMRWIRQAWRQRAAVATSPGPR